MNPCPVLHRARDQADLDQVHPVEHAPAGQVMIVARAISEAEAADRACPQQVRRPRARPVDPRNDTQAARILGDRFDRADALIGTVLP